MKIEMGKKYKTGAGEPMRILCVDGAHPIYPVIAQDSRGYPVSFTSEGKYCSDGKAASCSPSDLVEVSPYEDWPIDARVYVCMCGSTQWHKRHFAGLDYDGRPMAWMDGCTSFTTHSRAPWFQAKLAEDEDHDCSNG